MPCHYHRQHPGRPWVVSKLPGGSHASSEDGRADRVAGGMAAVTEPGAAPSESSIAEPTGWLLLIESGSRRWRTRGQARAGPDVGALDPLVNADLLRARCATRVCRCESASFRTAVPRPTFIPPGPLETGAAPTLVVFTRELDSIERMEQLCTCARQLAGLHAGVLACLFPEQPPLPALLRRPPTACAVPGGRRVLGIPAAVGLLDRAQSVRRVREQQRSGERA